jgi:release factor glutamine methyltransferase
MTSIRVLLDGGRRKLETLEIANAALDARLLLQNVTSLTHAEIVADPGRQVAELQAAAFSQLLDRRLRNEPVSRILGRREFYGRAFALNNAVLDPRADTETLIDAALGHMTPQARILDLGTGSGAIIVTLLAEAPHATGIATDLSGEALAVARNNGRQHGVMDRLELIQSSWFDLVPGVFDLIVSNPPYIPLADIAALPPDVRDFDPPLALDGGIDGLSAYRSIASRAGRHLTTHGHIVVEIGAGQESSVISLFASNGLRWLQSAKDLGGHVRCLTFTKL